MQAIAPELAVNAAISRTSFCPLPAAEVHLNTEPGQAVFRRQFPLPKSQYPVISHKLQQWQDNGVIEVVDTPSTFNTPFFLVPKKDATGAKTDFRICHDFRGLNALLANDSWPIPLISEIFEAAAGAQVFSTLDLWQAYHRFPIAAGDRHKTAFTWNGTQFQFRGAPFGLKTLPSHFQRVMAAILYGLDFARVFIDDVVVFSKTPGEHAAHLQEVIRRLNEARLILNIDKCHLGRLEVTLLGFRINPYGRKIDPSRLVNLTEWPVPTTAKQLRSFLGFVNYIREFVPSIATITAPLNGIRAKNDISGLWTQDCERAFQMLKEIIPQCPPLAHPDFERPFYVATDASAVGLGAVLYQLDPGTAKPRYVQFQARALNKAERNYSATKRELLAVVFAFARFHHYIYGRPFTLYTDHQALVYLKSQPHPNAMMQAWFDRLFSYDFKALHRPGIANILPDALSRLFALPGEESGSVNAAVNTASTAIPSASATDADEQPTRAVPPENQRADIILRHHLRGHFGVVATVDSVHEAGFDWPNLTAEVREACAKCLPCQRHNIAKHGYHPLSPISADQPFDHVAIDLAGPFPTSMRGNHYLFVLVDLHSRWVCLRAIPDKQSATIATTLFDVCATFGFPKIVQSDNGSEFVNSVVKQLFDGAKIDHRLTTPYHPRANGIAERTVQTATSTIKKLLDGAQPDWDASVPFVQFSMNTKVAHIHRSTPFAVMFGRAPNQFADHSSAPATRTTPDRLQAKIQFMKDAVFPGIAQLARATQNTAKASFDANHSLVNIPVGAHVMVRDVARRRKLDPRFEGPFKVVGKTRRAYILQDNTGALLPRNFPPSAIKVISADIAPDSPSHTVDTILDHRYTDRGYEYLVHWKGHSKDHDSWEPAINFDDEATISGYWRRRTTSA
jgi:transposase InsO family protein